MPWGANWKYHADGSAPDEGWNQPGFDDDGWDEGHAPVGFGRLKLHTLLERQEPSQPSVYFRREFQVDEASVLGAQLTAMHDDGIAVWLNGTLIHQRHMESGMGHAIYASASVNDDITTTLVDPDLLVSGTNTLAVMVKNNGPTSPDLNFDLQFEIIVPHSFDIDIVYPEEGQALGVDQVVPLMWETLGYAPTVDIEWSDDGGSTWQALATNTENTGRYDWPIPSTPSSGLMIRVLRTLDRSVFDEVGPLTSQVPTKSLAIPFESEWKYKDDNRDPGDGWYMAGYDDDDWESGDGGFGYEYDGLGTTLVKTTPAQTSTYFRKAFSLPNYVSGARVRLLIDDGAAIWVNGEEVAKHNVANLEHDRYATSTQNRTEEHITIPVEVLQRGSNVIGVMVKQSGRTSPDLYFDLELEVDALP